MRIAHWDTGRHLRGGQHQVLLLIESLRHQGEHRLLARGELLVEAQRRGWRAEPFTWWNALRAVDEVDVVHAHDARAHTVAAALGARHLAVARRVAFSIGRGWLSQWKYAQASIFIAVSRAVGRHLMAAGIPDSKIAVIYDGVTLPEHLSDFSGGVVALDSDDPGKCRTLLQSVAQAAGVPVELSKNLPVAFQTARLFLYPSLREGLGSAALLASAHGVPVLASRIEGLDEAVCDGVTGRLQVNEIGPWTSSLTSLLADEPRLREMGRAGRARMAAEFSAGAMAEATWAVYERICE